MNILETNKKSRMTQQRNQRYKEQANISFSGENTIIRSFKF